VTFTPYDATDYGTATVHVIIGVNKAALTVTAKVTRPYGTDNPILTASYTGFVNGDTASVVSGSPVLSTMATPASLPGPYPIAVGPGTLAAEPWPDVRDRLNATLRGWSRYFCQGDCYAAYSAVNHYVYQRVRVFLRRRHKVPSLGGGRHRSGGQAARRASQ